MPLETLLWFSIIWIVTELVTETLHYQQKYSPRTNAELKQAKSVNNVIIPQPPEFFVLSEAGIRIAKGAGGIPISWQSYLVVDWCNLSISPARRANGSSDVVVRLPLPLPFAYVKLRLIIIQPFHNCQTSFTRLLFIAINIYLGTTRAPL